MFKYAKIFNIPVYKSEQTEFRASSNAIVDGVLGQRSHNEMETSPPPSRSRSS